MSDLYLRFVNTSLGKQLVSSLSLPAPMELERQEKQDQPFIEGHVLLGAGPSPKALDPLADTLKAGATTLYVPDSPDSLSASQPLTKSHKAHALEMGNIGEHRRFKALVFDATGLRDTRDLRCLYDFFHPTIRQLARCIARVNPRFGRHLGVERGDPGRRRARLGGVRPSYDRDVRARTGLHFGAHPPDRVGRETDAPCGVEAIGGFQQPHIGLLDQIGIGLTRAAFETPCNRDGQRGEGPEQAVTSASVAVVLPGPHKSALRLGRQHVRSSDATGAMGAVCEWLVHCDDAFDVASTLVWSASDCQSDFDSLSVDHDQ